jgi:hypothetical protein
MPMLIYKTCRADMIVFGSDLDRVPIEPMVLVEARVLRGYDSVLEIGRDLAQRNEFVAFVIWRVVNPGLQAALDVHRGCRRVDPPGSHKDQRGMRPKNHNTNDKPSNKGSQETLPKRKFGERWMALHSHLRIIAGAGVAYG